MECPKCHKIMADGAHFCSNCGAALATVEAAAGAKCRFCGATINPSAVFCPACGRMVRNDFAEPEPVEPTIDSATNVKPEPARPEPAAPAVRREAIDMEAVDDERPEPVATAVSGDAVDTEMAEVPAEEPRSNYNRNVVIGVLVALGLILLLTLMRDCNTGGTETETPVAAAGDSTAAVTALPAVSVQEALNIFKTELSRHNLSGDDALAMAATYFPGSVADNVPDHIVGVTLYNAPDASRSFIKIYLLDRSGSSWTPVLKQTKYFNGRTLDMSDNALRPEAGAIPASASVAGHDAMLFAMYNVPQGFAVGNTARVTMALYDLESDKLHLLDYDGVTKRRDDGKVYVYGKPLQGTAGPQLSFLRDAAPKVHAIYFPTEEELKAEQEEKERLEEEARKNDPDNAEQTWAEENAETMEQVNEQGGAKVNVKTFDKPFFNLRDNKRKLDYATHLVFCDNEGKVYGFDKNTRKYYVIYSSASAAASDIAKGSRGDHDLEIITATGSLHYDLSTNRLSR